MSESDARIWIGAAAIGLITGCAAPADEGAPVKDGAEHLDFEHRVEPTRIELDGNTVTGKFEYGTDRYPAYEFVLTSAATVDLRFEWSGGIGGQIVQRVARALQRTPCELETCPTMTLAVADGLATHADDAEFWDVIRTGRTTRITEELQPGLYAIIFDADWSYYNDESEFTLTAATLPGSGEERSAGVVDINLALESGGPAAYIEVYLGDQHGVTDHRGDVTLYPVRAGRQDLRLGFQGDIASGLTVAVHGNGSLTKVPLVLSDDFFEVVSASSVVGTAWDTPIEIPDNDQYGVKSFITLSGEGRIEEVYADLAIDHPYSGDLSVILVCPDGSARVLFDRVGGSSPDVVGPFSASESCRFGPIEGTYELWVRDLAPRDVGSLTSWSVRVQPCTTRCPP